MTDQRWFDALADARAGRRTADVLWIGDSLSVLLPGGGAPNWRPWATPPLGWQPLAWQVGWLLSGRLETYQFRAGSGDAHLPALVTDAEGVPAADAGFGGWTLRLRPGESARFASCGEGVSVMWSRAPGGGELRISRGGVDVGAFGTDCPPARSRVTAFSLPPFEPSIPGGSAVHDGEADVVVEAGGETVLVEGIYLHERNLRSGVRVWPAARPGVRTRQFVEHPSWALDSLASLDPALVVVATGTNDDSYPDELDALLDAVAGRSPEAPVAVWLPPCTPRFGPAEAEAGRAVAERRGATVIDAAGSLGPLPTVDGIHPTAVTVALCSGHVAGALEGSGDAAAALAGVVTAMGHGQRWSPASGAVDIGSMAGEPVVRAHRDADDAQPALALVLEAGARTFMGLPGSSVSLGAGGDAPLDTHLSRAGSGRLSVNAGAGQLDVARIAVGVGDAPPAPEGGVVLHGRSEAGRSDLLATLPDGATRVLTSDGDTVAVPLPCALGLHRSVGAQVALDADQAVWVPAPALAQACVATHVWVDVVRGSSAAFLTLAIVAAGRDGLPGEVLGASPTGAVDLADGGICGAELEAPVPIPAGRRWWVALGVTGGGASDVVLRGAGGLLAGAPLHLGAGPVRPDSSEVDGSLRMGGVSAIPASPPAAAGLRGGTAPVVHVSLEAAGD